MTLEFLTYKIPIRVSLRDFILKEKFECVKLGATKGWLSKNFPEPDDYFSGKSAVTSNIWRYGNLEFHFHNDILFMIFTDYVESVDGGPKLDMDLWELESDEPSFLIDWIRIFNLENRDFKVVQKPGINQTHIILRDVNSGPVLSFVGPEDSGKEPKDGNPKLGAICLWDTEFMK